MTGFIIVEIHDLLTKSWDPRESNNLGYFTMLRVLGFGPKFVENERPTLALMITFKSLEAESLTILIFFFSQHLMVLLKCIVIGQLLKLDPIEAKSQHEGAKIAKTLYRAGKLNERYEYLFRRHYQWEEPQ